MVNSKTKTALANLLSNRQQGNSGPEPNATSFASALTSTTSTTQAMCPPPPSSVTSQSLPHSAPTTTQSNILVQRKSLANLTNGCKTIQVNSFAGARVATSQSSPTLAPTPARPQYYGHDSQTKSNQYQHVFWGKCILYTNKIIQCSNYSPSNGTIFGMHFLDPTRC